MDLEGTARELLATVGNFLNTILGGVVNLLTHFSVSSRKICAPGLAWWS